LFVTIHHDRGSRFLSARNHHIRIDLRKHPQGIELPLPYQIMTIQQIIHPKRSTPSQPQDLRDTP
jgi:hypothetical protein